MNSSNLLNRPQLYFNIDGVGELGIGFMLASGAAILWQQAHSAPNSIWNRWYTFLILLFLVLSVIQHGSKAIKNHITYPRTGYVEYRKRDTFWIPMILGAVVAALGGAGLVTAVRRHWDIAAVAALLGLAFAAHYAYNFVRTAPWKWVVAGVMAGASLAIVVIPAKWLETLAGGSSDLNSAATKGTLLYFFAAYGIIFLVSGAISFWLYLRCTHAALAEDQ
jgi:hypothetical protein